MGNEEFLKFTVFGVNEYFYLRLTDEQVLTSSEMDPKILEQAKVESEVPAEYKYLWRSYTNFFERKNQLSSTSSNDFKNLELFSDEKNRSTSQLEDKYPLIRKAIENREYIIIDYSQAPPSAKELAKLLTPKGENPWKDVVLFENGSKDVKEHKLTSVEDFLKWYQPD